MTRSSSLESSSAVTSRPRQPLDVAVVGATGNVGTMMLRVLEERDIPLASLRAFASERSVGKRVGGGDYQAEVEDLATADTDGIEIALFSAGAQRALDHAQSFIDAGAVVIDNSSAYRMYPGVPLVVPEVNAHAIAEHNGIIANPNCSTIQLVTALKPIADAVGLERVQVTTFQAVSGTGQAAMEELHRQATDVLEARELKAEVYPHQIAFNVLPHCDSFDEHGNTKEELKLLHETRKIMGLPELRIAATCVRVPVYNGHSEAVHIQTREPLTPDAARDLLRDAPGVRLVDDPASNSYPMPVDASGVDDVLVGRIRVDSSVENGLALFVVADNLRKGAATNAIQILEQLAT